MSMMERILRVMAEKQASDVYLSAHSPALIKIDGECMPVNRQLLTPEAPGVLLAESVSPQDMDVLAETGELHVAVPLQGVDVPCTSAARWLWWCAFWPSRCPRSTA